LGLDLEATGKEPETAIPVQFALAYWDGEKFTQVRHGLINPGVPIPEESTAIHHITDEMVAERGGDLDKSIIGIIGELVTAQLAGTPVVAMNGSYDLTVLDRCYRRAGGGGLVEDFRWNGPLIDPLVIDRHIDRFRKGSRTLSALCHQYQVLLGEAHQAYADVAATVQLARYVAWTKRKRLDIDPLELHALQVVWHREWLDSFNEYRAKKGDPALPPEEGDWPIRGRSACVTETSDVGSTAP
jgi:DNA polymerase-3 subunit epsilon